MNEYLLIQAPFQTIYNCVVWTAGLVFQLALLPDGREKSREHTEAERNHIWQA